MYFSGPSVARTGPAGVTGSSAHGLDLWRHDLTDSSKELQTRPEEALRQNLRGS